MNDIRTASLQRHQIRRQQGQRLSYERVVVLVYALAVLVALSLWFLAIRAPLWLDETHSFYLIKRGVAEIMSRQGWHVHPFYPYVLWLWSEAMGTGEVALRIPSVLAMLGAAYLLCRAAWELFDRDVAIIVTVIFCLHPIVIFESIDIRPYAFAALAINASILALVYLRHNESNWLAALFGLAAGCIGHFLFLFTVILPALAVCFVAVKTGDRKIAWRQGGVAVAAFALVSWPVVSVLRLMFQSRSTHVFEDAPKLSALGVTLAPGWLPCIVAGAILVAWATQQLDLQSGLEGWRILFCAALALIPILILYGVSVETSIHVFVFRYRLVAIPGIALGWGLIVSRIGSSTLRSLLCVAVVASVACWYVTSPLSRQHGYTWKYALETAEKNASADDAPVLVCSDFPESDSVPMPVGEAVKDSGLFAPLTYYTLSVPVVGLPRALNEEAMGIVSSFLQQSGKRKQRFLALGFKASRKTLEFIESSASPTYSVHKLGVFDGIAVEEFTPRQGNGVELEHSP